MTTKKKELAKSPSALTLAGQKDSSNKVEPMMMPFYAVDTTIIVYSITWFEALDAAQ